MLHEMKNVRQNEAGIRRRWFTDDYFDLIVWINLSDEPIGFQLCYDVDGRERALTLLKGFFRHTKIDSGEDIATMHRTPILSADGVFDSDRILERFVDASASMDTEVREYVIEGIRAYGAATGGSMA